MTTSVGLKFVSRAGLTASVDEMQGPPELEHRQSQLVLSGSPLSRLPAMKEAPGSGLPAEL